MARFGSTPANAHRLARRNDGTRHWHGAVEHTIYIELEGGTIVRHSDVVPRTQFHGGRAIEEQKPVRNAHVRTEEVYVGSGEEVLTVKLLGQMGGEGGFLSATFQMAHHQSIFTNDIPVLILVSGDKYPGLKRNRLRGIQRWGIRDEDKVISAIERECLSHLARCKCRPVLQCAV